MLAMRDLGRARCSERVVPTPGGHSFVWFRRWFVSRTSSRISRKTETVRLATSPEPARSPHLGHRPLQQASSAQWARLQKRSEAGAEGDAPRDQPIRRDVE